MLAYAVRRILTAIPTALGVATVVFLLLHAIPGDPVEPYPIETEARFGSVNLGNGSRTDVLFANGSAGDIWRREYVSFGDYLTMSIEAPPAGPNPAHFALYIVPYEPGLGDLLEEGLSEGLLRFDDVYSEEIDAEIVFVADV